MTAMNRCPTCFRWLDDEPCDDALCLADATTRGLQDLPLGHLLQGYLRVGRVLGRGGFGITYLALDERLDVLTAVKECFPSAIARRLVDRVTVDGFNKSNKEAFQKSWLLFEEEARLLARFRNEPNIVYVKTVFRANNTAYLVMEYLEGSTLDQYLKELPDPRLAPADAYRLLRPVFQVVKTVHDAGYLHRDISADNVFVLLDGTVKLLDFGSARQHIVGRETRTIHHKPGYTALEQYYGRQGVYTDVYAIAATFYRCITGELPPDAPDRLEQDELVPPSRCGVVMPPAAEAALLQALAVKGPDRLQTIEQLTEGLDTLVAEEEVYEEVDEQPEPTQDSPPEWEPTVVARRPWQSEAGEPPQIATDRNLASEPTGDIDLTPETEEAGASEVSEEAGDSEASEEAGDSEASDEPAAGPGTVDPGIQRPPDVSETRRRGGRAVAVSIAATLAVIVGLLVYLVAGRALKPPVPGVLVIDAAPWGNVVSAVNDRNEPVDGVAGPTPRAVSLPPGKYRLRLTGPDAGQPDQEIQAEVLPDQVVNAPLATFSGIAVDEYFATALKGRE